MVGKSQNESLTHQLLDFLIGETDGIPKDSNYIYKLYIALKKYEEAAKTAIIIADQEQEIGNYTLAHSVLYEATQYLEVAKVKIPQTLRQKFILLHSYMLVKSLVRAGNHTGASRLLQRVIHSISQFPQHIVAILTSAVIECQRANMKLSCYEYAVMLMKPEYRPIIDPNLKRKIEAIVRRKIAQNEEAEDGMSLCPICSQLMPDYQLECNSTHEAIPMCVITGKHMLLDDWCFCPNSKAPALYSEYVRYINSANTPGTGDGSDALASTATPSGPVTDPIMNKPVSLSDLQKVETSEAATYIKRYNNVVDEETKRPTNGDGGKEDPETDPQEDKDGEGSSSSRNGGRSLRDSPTNGKANVSRMRGKKVTAKSKG